MFIHDNRIISGRPVAVDPDAVARMIERAWQQRSDCEAHRATPPAPPHACADIGDLWIRRCNADQTGE